MMVSLLLRRLIFWTRLLTTGNLKKLHRGALKRMFMCTVKMQEAPSICGRYYKKLMIVNDAPLGESLIMLLEALIMLQEYPIRIFENVGSTFLRPLGIVKTNFLAWLLWHFW
jgi:hypothetical protein